MYLSSSSPFNTLARNQADSTLSTPPPSLPHLVCPVSRFPCVLQKLQPLQHTGQEPGGLKGAIGISRPKRLIPCGPAVGNVNAIPCILFIARQEESQSLEGQQGKLAQCLRRSKQMGGCPHCSKPTSFTVRRSWWSERRCNNVTRFDEKLCPVGGH